MRIPPSVRARIREAAARGESLVRFYRVGGWAKSTVYGLVKRRDRRVYVPPKAVLIPLPDEPPFCLADDLADEAWNFYSFR